MSNENWYINSNKLRHIKAIDSFSGRYVFLSNFYYCFIIFGGFPYRSVEHAYQAAKCANKEDRILFCHKDLTPGRAKRMGQNVELSPTWEDDKLGIMKELVSYKFKTSPPLAYMLKATGDQMLIEGNTWGDTFWGKCKGVGENHLGKILMEVRGELNE